MTSALPSRKRTYDVKWKGSNIAALPEPETVIPEEILSRYRGGEVELICVLGPTASGKTKYAVGLAEELRRLSGEGAEIISADSRQVYRGMDIGTGKDLSDYGDVPYHLIDIADPGEGYNVYRFQQDFSAAWQDIRRRGGIPILCGGTGMYISAVCSGYNFRERKPLSCEKPEGAAPAPCPLPSSTYFIGTLVDRDTRNSRIDARLDARLKEGMVDEIRGLLDSGVDKDVLIAYGLEYKFVTEYILGEMDYDTMRSRLSIAIHQFAKRQMTWWRGMERSGLKIHWTR